MGVGKRAEMLLAAKEMAQQAVELSDCSIVCKLHQRSKASCDRGGPSFWHAVFNLLRK